MKKNEEEEEDAEKTVWNPFINSLSLLKGDIDHPASSFTQLKVSIKVDDSKPCMNFTPQLLINNCGVSMGWHFLASTGFSFFPLDN
jgi:hypothetical protein